jgi:hypothetical protein
MVSRSWIASITRTAMASVVPIAGAGPAATVQFAVPAALVTHEFVDDPGRDAGVLQPGREGVPEVVGTAELEVVEVGALDGGLVHATDAVSGQHGPGPGGHMVAATRASEHQHIRSPPGGSPSLPVGLDTG